MKITFTKTVDYNFTRILKGIIERRGKKVEKVEKVVRKIIDAVEKEGDRALSRYSRILDGIRLGSAGFEVKAQEIDRALGQVSKNDLRALRLAARRIGNFHRRQLEKSWSYHDPIGMTLGQRIHALDRVGVYVPGGKACYPSTVLMTIIPAKVAGVREIIMTSPVRKNAAPTLAAAHIAGANRIFRIGGAQAIAALAYGTKTIPRVDKIIGPGNVYVATAKRLVFGQVGIDSIAGPSEVLILADFHADPLLVAADMLSQAEHDEMAAALCVTSSLSFAHKVREALDKLIRETKRQAITLKALERYGAIITTRSLDEGIAIVNAIAPEHVEIMVRKPDRWIPSIKNAGAMFIGPYSTPPLGDYLAGPNHVLPTGGSARYFSPLGTYDFLKRTSLVWANKKSLTSLAPWIVHLARIEGLDEHARAVELRIRKKERLNGKKG